MPEDTFAALFEAQAEAQPKRRALRVGETIEAAISQIGRETVFVELDGKRQGMLDIEEVRGADGSIEVKIGDTVRARVLEVDANSGAVRLGRSFGKGADAAHLQQAFEGGIPVEGKVTLVNKGGLEVDLGKGVRGFCPMSQIGPRGAAIDAQSLVGTAMQFQIADFKDGGRNVVLSRRRLLEEERREAREATLRTLAPGKTVTGTVTAVRDFGAFVDLGDVEGLIPASELSHERGAAMESRITAGETVTVQVLDLKTDDRGQLRITLSRCVLSDPGCVLSDPDQAPTVSSDPDHAPTVLSDPDHAPARLSDPDRSPNALGRAGGRRAAPAAKLAIGTVVKGRVVRVETYGVFLQVDGSEGRAGRGLVPVSELGVPRGADLRKLFPQGTELSAAVLETGDGRLKLSVVGAKNAAEHAQFEAHREAVATKSFGTLGDLLKKARKAK